MLPPPRAFAWRRWKGLPENAARSGLSALQREKEDRERSLDMKKGQLADLLVQQISFRNLARRNRSNATARATAAAAAAAAGNGAECAGDEDADEVAASKVKDGKLVKCTVLGVEIDLTPPGENIAMIGLITRAIVVV